MLGGSLQVAFGGGVLRGVVVIPVLLLVFNLRFKDFPLVYEGDLGEPDEHRVRASAQVKADVEEVLGDFELVGLAVGLGCLDLGVVLLGQVRVL